MSAGAGAASGAAGLGGDLRDAFEALAGAARGGRVAHRGFLDEADAAALLAALRRDGVAATAWGGRPAARRRIVTARPDGVPEAGPRLGAIYLPGLHEADAAIAAVRRGAQVPAERLGDVVPHRDGVSVIVSGTLPDGWREGVGQQIAGAGVPEEVPLERVAGGTVKEARLVVPSTRADVLGAKAFGASRSWFTKGVGAGKVRIDGVAAGKSATLEVGGELWAEGLGRVRLDAIEGETKRGNAKVVVRVERP